MPINGSADQNMKENEKKFSMCSVRSHDILFIHIFLIRMRYQMRQNIVGNKK